MTTKKIPQLHEILAVEQEIKANAERVRGQTVDIFRTRQSHFVGMRRTFRPFAVDEDYGETGAERLEAETRLVTTVPEEIAQMLKTVGQALDIGFQIDEANTAARADLVIDGEVLAKDVPATFLLQLEKRLKEIRTVLKEIPTFDPVRIWSVDPGADKKHVLRAEPVTTIRKQRQRKYNVMVEASKEHPAQVDIVEVEVPIGEIRAYDWTGMISPGRKAALLEQIDKLSAAVKSARSRANTTPVADKKVAERLFHYLLQPLEG
ncbi:MAG: hypothetical protein ACAI44_29260 [Candidatus Sericytochromatia bacterium]